MSAAEVFFTSDTHFSHKRLAEKRGFTSIEEHDERIISNWNNIIGPNDRCYHLGDFSFGTDKRAREIFHRLNGIIYLIRGNHDDRLGASFATKFVWLKDAHYFAVSGQKIYLHHYACRVWRSSHYGSWHLYGHSHGSLKSGFYDGMSRSMDVGIDCNDLKPFHFDEIKIIMDKRKFEPVDHHKVRATI